MADEEVKASEASNASADADQLQASSNLTARPLEIPETPQASQAGTDLEANVSPKEPFSNDDLLFEEDEKAELALWQHARQNSLDHHDVQRHYAKDDTHIPRRDDDQQMNMLPDYELTRTDTISVADEPSRLGTDVVDDKPISANTEGTRTSHAGNETRTDGEQANEMPDEMQEAQVTSTPRTVESASSMIAAPAPPLTESLEASTQSTDHQKKAGDSIESERQGDSHADKRPIEADVEETSETVDTGPQLDAIMEAASTDVNQPAPEDAPVQSSTSTKRKAIEMEEAVSPTEITTPHMQIEFTTTDNQPTAATDKRAPDNNNSQQSNTTQTSTSTSTPTPSTTSIPSQPSQPSPLPPTTPLIASLTAELSTLLSHFRALPALSSHLPPNSPSAADLDETTALSIATAVNQRHIRLLHEYNEIRDVGMGLMGLIADARGVRVRDVQEEFGIGGKD